MTETKVHLPGTVPPEVFIKGFRPWHRLYGVRLKLEPRNAHESVVGLHVAGCEVFCVHLSPLHLFRLLSSSRFFSTFPVLSLYTSFLNCFRDRTSTTNPWYAVLLLKGERSLVETVLSEEILALVFSYLPPKYLGILQCVCQMFWNAAQAPSLWKAACVDAFAAVSQGVNERLLREHYGSSWKRMFLERPHLFFDGVYVSRNTYIRTGVTEWKVKNPVHLVAYYRYYRFFKDGTLVYRTSPETLAKVAKSLQGPAAGHLREESSSCVAKSRKKGESTVFLGKWRLVGEKLYTVLRYDNSTGTELRCRMKLRSTVPGANNRLDIEALETYDRSTDSRVSMSVATEEVDHGTDAERRAYRRGMSSYVFVPWSQVQSHVLNLPVEQMDVWVPG